MAENSKIEWTHHTFNAWWGCVRVSEACRNCYAEALAKRYGFGWGPTARRRFFGEAHWREPLKWNRKAEEAGERQRVFCSSMADVFEQLPPGHPDAEQMERERIKLWALIRETPHLDWMLLTKRPENASEPAPADWGYEGWPRNVWLGTTVEDQANANKRIPHLLRAGARVRFLSMEPLLGPVDLSPWLGDVPVNVQGAPRQIKRGTPDWENATWFNRFIHLVITGGESGHGARPSNPDWFRSLRNQCQETNTAFHFKQWGEFGPVMQWPYPVTTVAGDDIIGLGRIGKKNAGRILDGRTWDEMPGGAA